MGTVAIVIIIVVVLLAVAGAAALVLARRRKQQQLAEQFGPEYERRVEETGDRKQAEQELQQRKERHDQHQLRPLQPDERERLRADWQQVQRGFVDNPGGAVEHADALLVTIMRQRGYPVEDGPRRTDDLSVAQPHLVGDYRRAQDVVTSHRQGTASTEDLRYAFTSFRTLVEAMLDDDGGEGQGRHDQHDQQGRHQQNGTTERISGSPRGAGDQQIGHPDAGTERIQQPPPAGAPGQGAPPGGAPAQGAPQGGPVGPGRPPSAPPATGGPDGHQERRA
jgi:hypothetical protein